MMKRLVLKTIFGMCAEAVLLSAVITALIAGIGYLRRWDAPLAYSNAFFLAGCLAIIAGTSSRLAAGQEWGSFQLLSGESFRDMNSSERANYILNASSSFRLVILGALTGLLLILLSAVAAYLL